MNGEETNTVEPLAGHVAIIMDGNGRWARKHGKSRSAGHQEGAETLRRIIKACIEIGIPYLTVYAFSIENFKRPSAEVSFLMTMIGRYLRSETPVFVKEGIRLKVIGELERFSSSLRKSVKQAVEATTSGKRLNLTVALGYGSRQEIIGAATRLAEKARVKESGSVPVTPEAFDAELLTAGMPDVDLLIRTGGEMRLSNFLLYQCSYAELYFTEKFWPDFNKDDLLEAIREFASRDRRFGEVRQEDGGAKV